MFSSGIIFVQNKQIFIDIKEINIAENPDIAVKHGIMSTPAFIINDKLAFTSAPSEDELKKKIDELKDWGISKADNYKHFYL